jgi:prepilin-type N-terminal cleavage/methylation domain-containing protein
MLRSARNAAFTLIELSIVLVIIGLIVGGVLVGRDLIEVAQVRKVISDVEKFQTAFNTFQVKYNCIPGDCPNATQFWGTDTNCPFQPARAAPATPTCDGDGDGQIVSNEDNINFAYESWRAWQQLGNAGLIAGSYSGTSWAGNSQSMTMGPGVNSPAIFNSSHAITVHYLINGGWGLVTSVRYQNVFDIFGPTNAATGTGFDPPFTPGQMFSIDSKLDDGHAMTGRVVSGIYDTVQAGFVSCLTVQAPGGDYNLTETIPACTPTFTAGF